MALRNLELNQQRQRERVEEFLRKRDEEYGKAAAIQAAVRGHLARRALTYQTSCARKIQRNFRNHRKLKMWYAAERRRRLGPEVGSVIALPV